MRRQRDQIIAALLAGDSTLDHVDALELIEEARDAEHALHELVHSSTRRPLGPRRTSSNSQAGARPCRDPTRLTARSCNAGAYVWAEPANGVIWPYDPGDDPGVVAGMNVGSRVRDMLGGAGRGAVGAMAMTGMRVLTTELGLVEQTPPQALSRQRARGLRALLRRAPREQRRGLIEAAHWAFGAGGGAAFGALPREVRCRPWAGPLYGLVVWLGFELGIAPALGLSQAKRVRLLDRLALAADHLLYGLVLSATRPSPRR